MLDYVNNGIFFSCFFRIALVVAEWYDCLIISFKKSVAMGGTASSQLSEINSVPAQSGANEIDEFDMLAQLRNETKS